MPLAPVPDAAPELPGLAEPPDGEALDPSEPTVPAPVPTPAPEPPDADPLSLAPGPCVPPRSVSVIVSVGVAGEVVDVVLRMVPHATNVSAATAPIVSVPNIPFIQKPLKL